MDELISRKCKLFNSSTKRRSIAFENTRYCLMPAQKDVFAEKGISTVAIMARFFVLLNLNIKIGTLLPLIDFSIEREKLVCLSQENIAFTSTFGQKIHSIKNIIFHKSQDECLERAFRCNNRTNTTTNG